MLTIEDSTINWTLSNKSYMNKSYTYISYVKYLGFSSSVSSLLYQLPLLSRWTNTNENIFDTHVLSFLNLLIQYWFLIISTQYSVHWLLYRIQFPFKSLKFSSSIQNFCNREEIFSRNGSRIIFLSSSIENWILYQVERRL